MARSFRDRQFGRMREQLGIAQIPAYCPEQIQRAVPRDQIEMAGGFEVRRIGFQAAVWLDPKDRVECVEHRQEATYVGGIA
jgi:hypothetical protein